MTTKQLIILCISILLGFILHAVIVTKLDTREKFLEISEDKRMLFNHKTGQTFRYRSSSYPSAEGPWGLLEETTKTTSNK